MKNFGNIVLMFLSVFIFQSTAQAYVMTIGDVNTCAFECADQVKCTTGFNNHTNSVCLGSASSCDEVATKTCGKGLKWVHQGKLDLNLDVAKIKDGNQEFSDAAAEKQLDVIFHGIERK